MTGAIRETKTEKLYHELGLEPYKIGACCKGYVHFTKYIERSYSTLFS